MEYVILVDENDRAIGTAEKLSAHAAPGHLHRAISVFLFDPSGRLLMQQRATKKHHFRELWSNTCCSHPRPNEGIVEAGRRRLTEEMGVEAEVEDVGSFMYEATDADSGLIERELDHVLVGSFDGIPAPNPSEVKAWKFSSIEDLAEQTHSEPHLFTPWFASSLEIAMAHL